MFLGDRQVLRMPSSEEEGMPKYVQELTGEESIHDRLKQNSSGSSIGTFPCFSFDGTGTKDITGTFTDADNNNQPVPLPLPAEPQGGPERGLRRGPHVRGQPARARRGARETPGRVRGGRGVGCL